MRVLVYPHDLNMGGSQINALDIAAKVREFGVEPIIFGRPGVLWSRLQDLGLEFIESPDPGRRPSLRIARYLRALARSRNIDILHGYEWPPALECAAAAFGSVRTSSVATVMSMAVAPFIPRSIPLIVGTEQIAAAERTRAHRRNVFVIEPPVDLEHNVAPPAAEISAFRESWGLREGAVIVTCVSRLASELKSEGLLSAIHAISDHLSEIDVQLLIVGDGPAREQIQAAADAANARVAQSRVILTGELLDPRAAYEVADVVVGMGGSALRAMAFRKPLIVQGERGYFRLLTQESWKQFAWQGWYGVGADQAKGSATFGEILRKLIVDDNSRNESSAFGRTLIEERFSLESAARQQFEIYATTLGRSHSAGGSVISAVRSIGMFGDYYVRRKANRILGRGSADDFNAKPVAGRSAPGPEDTTSSKSAVVYLSGAPWHAVSGTDLNLAKALGRIRPVVWVDPPVSIVARIKRNLNVSRISQVSEGVTRIHSTALPGVTRPGVRALAQWRAYRLTRAHLRRLDQGVLAVITSSPEPLLARWKSVRTTRIYFATDDFVAGAGLLGLSKDHVSRALQSNLRSADVALAVSPPLVSRLERRGANATLFPNGTDLQRYENIEHVPMAQDVWLRPPIAGVFGQLNERLDLDLLESVVNSGVSVLLLGPRYDQHPDFQRRLSGLVASPNVQWVGRKASHELCSYMALVKVGLTPYTITHFNLASFPLKTLEYLAAGRPVVSSKLPANDLLDPRVVHSADTVGEFVSKICELLVENVSAETSELCRQEAERFSWAARARDLDGIITEISGEISSLRSPGCSHRGATS